MIAAFEQPSRETAEDGLIVRVVGHIAWLTFNRPDAGNAMDAAMMAALPGVWRDLDQNPEVRVIIVTGAGRSFQTGLDVKQLAKDKDALREMSRRTKRAELGLTGWHNGVSKPIVTAVNGLCAGGGLHFVVDSDVVIASATATFADPHVSLGQVSAFETIGLARRAAFSPVARLALVGAHERVDAARALELGWVSEVVPPDELADAALAVAQRIAENDPAAVAATKRALWQALEMGLTAARRTTLEAEPTRGATQ